MNKDIVKSILTSSYNEELAEKTLNSFLEIEGNYFVQKWNPSELHAGHFVESVRRIIEFEINNGPYTSFVDKIPNFSDSALKQYEQATHIDESFRILIPRVLKSIYNIRNKRGVGHIKDISPNEMDATLILYSAKWVLAELIRLKSNLSIEETQYIIDNIVERNINLLWKTKDITRILDPKISTKNQVLIILYDNSILSVEKLRDITEYKNKSYFKTLIKQMHSERLLELNTDDDCVLSPKGQVEAEKIIKLHMKSDRIIHPIKI